MDKYDPTGDRTEVAGGLGGRASLLRPESGARRGAGAEVLHARDAPVSLRDAAHGARPELHAGGRDHALPAAHRVARDAPHGLRFVRPAGGERGHSRRRSSAGDRRAEHRAHPDRDGAPGLGHRLGPRDLRARGRVLPLDPVAVPEVLRGGSGLPESRACPVVPERPDRRRERVRDRREVRAVRHSSRREEHGPVVLQDHRLCGSAAGRPGADRLARADEDDPDELDRPLGGRRGHLPGRGARSGHPRLHDPAGHAVRRDVLRPGAGAPGRREAGERRGGRLRGESRGEARRGAPDEGEGRRLHRPLRRQPGQRRADPGLGRRLRADGLRDRRDHGRSGARRARP